MSSRDKVIYLFLAVAQLTATVAFFSSAGLWVVAYNQPLLGILCVLLITKAGARQALTWFTVWSMRRPTPMEADDGLRVAIATTFVPGSEPLSMLEQSLEALTKVAYPHDTFVLDEGDCPGAKELCRRLGATHFTRKNITKYNQKQGTFLEKTKVGNLNAWLHDVGFGHYDFVTFIDPDHIVEPTFLHHVLGYFRDPKIGFVQAPQVYYNQKKSVVARAAAEDTYVFYGPMLRGLYGAGIYWVDGCHTTFRMSLLEMLGEYPVHTGEDLLMTYELAARGVPGVYVQEVLARGETPVDWRTYVKQQYRWAFSGVNIKLRRFRQSAKTMSPLRSILLLDLGLVYFFPFLTPLATIALCAALLMGDIPSIPFHTIAWLCIMFTLTLSGTLWLQKFNIIPERERGLMLRSMLAKTARWPAGILALVRGVLNRHSHFITSAKGSALKPSLSLFWPQMLVVLSLSTCLIYSLTTQQQNGILIQFLAGLTLLENSILLLTATRY